MNVYTMDIVLESPDKLNIGKLNYLQDKIIKLVEEEGFYCAGGIRPYTQLDEFLDKSWIMEHNHGKSKINKR